jgi:hypothetical protein
MEFLTAPLDCHGEVKITPAGATAGLWFTN